MLIYQPHSEWYNPPCTEKIGLYLILLMQQTKTASQFVIGDGKREVTWFIIPSRDRTTLTKLVIFRNESIYFLHPYLGILLLSLLGFFWHSQSGFAHTVNLHSIWIPLWDVHMNMDRIPACPIKSSQIINVIQSVQLADCFVMLAYFEAVIISKSILRDQVIYESTFERFINTGEGL